MRLSIILAGLLLVIPATAAEPQQELRVETECANNGVFVQAGITSEYNCDGDCTNNGVAVSASVRSGHSCTGSCQNNGIMVFGPGGGCQSAALPGACAGDVCTPNCNRPCETPRTNQRGAPPETCRVSNHDLAVECAYSEKCGVLENGVCWTMRLACTIAYNQTRVDEILEEANVRCHTWNLVFYDD